MTPRFLSGFCALFILCSCEHEQAANRTAHAAVKDSVTRMMTQISADITKGGPTKWLAWFEDDPGFFMASDGVVKFGDYRSAIAFTRDTLPHIISRISLTWNNLRVDSLTPELAAVGADFKEEIAMSSGQAITDSGFFSAIAHFDGMGWKLRDLNWASKFR
jgi:hypothetical protein